MLQIDIPGFGEVKLEHAVFDYNGKLACGLLHRINNHVYPSGTKILWIHTGGLQGINGFNLRWKGKYHLEQK